MENEEKKGKYIPLDFEKLLIELDSGLKKLSESFNNQEINNIIGNDKQNFKEGLDKNIKEYKRRSSILLDIIKSFVELLISLVEKIKILAHKLEKDYKEVNSSSSYFKDKNDEEGGIKNINFCYIDMCEAFEEIEDLFLKIERVDYRRKKLNINKLYNLDKNINFHNIGIKEIYLVYRKFSSLIEKILEFGKNFKEEYNKIKKEEKEIRIDVLIILDVTSSMNEYLNTFKINFIKMIDELKEKCLGALVYLGFIGYRDIVDIELGDDYIDINFSVNYKNLEKEIQKIKADGGDDIPEDIAGAFEMALKKEWRGDTKIVLLITDSPCHGNAFHKTNIMDNYPDDTNIKNMIHQFTEKNINLICFNLSQNTKTMFEIFKNEYNSLEGKCFFEESQYLIQKFNEENRNKNDYKIDNSFMDRINSLFNENLKKASKNKNKKRNSQRIQYQMEKLKKSQDKLISND